MVKRDLIAECLPKRDHYMAAAWLALISYVSGNEHYIAEFEKHTGMKFIFPKGIEGMVDEASGYQEDLVFKFAHWVTKNFWGDTSEENRNV
jgi:hypothetical protein